MLEVEVWVKVDANGDYAVGTDADNTQTAYADTIGTDDGTPCRMVKVTLRIPAPKPVEIECTVPDMVNEGTATVRG